MNIAYSNIERANVTTTVNQNIYSYADQSLLISYGFAVLASAIAVLLGGYSLYQSGVSHDSSPSTFASTMQNPVVRIPYLNFHARFPTNKTISRWRVSGDSINISMITYTYVEVGYFCSRKARRSTFVRYDYRTMVSVISTRL